MKTCEKNSEEVHEIIHNSLTFSLYSRGELLGSGGFAKCYLLTDINTGRKVAGTTRKKYPYETSKPKYP
uniref:Protein kinase domain-containing protein n=1 Tax=Strongyloides papillosus TaxID=174720 RepID=A0A0N5B426_STREA